MSTYGLGLHTTSPDLGLAISNSAGRVRSQVLDLGKDLSNYLHYYLAAFIQPQDWKDFQFLAVAKGPGGFTSTRMGVVTARTLAQQLNLPLFAISTLATIAWHHRSSAIPGADLAVELPARRGEIFVAIYRPMLNSVALAENAKAATDVASPLSVALPDQVISREAWQDKLTHWEHPLHLIKGQANLGYSVISLLELAYLDWCLGQRPHWSTAIPFYGQHPV